MIRSRVLMEQRGVEYLSAAKREMRERRAVSLFFSSSFPRSRDAAAINRRCAAEALSSKCPTSFSVLSSLVGVLRERLYVMCAQYIKRASERARRLKWSMHHARLINLPCDSPSVQ